MNQGKPEKHNNAVFTSMPTPDPQIGSGQSLGLTLVRHLALHANRIICTPSLFCYLKKKQNSTCQNDKLVAPWWLSGKEPAWQCRRHETWVHSLGWEDSLEEDMATYSSILA